MKTLLFLIAGILTVVGALNWGFVGLADMNIVHALFSNLPQVEKLIYIVVGLSGIISGASLFQTHFFKD